MNKVANPLLIVALATFSLPAAAMPLRYDYVGNNFNSLGESEPPIGDYDSTMRVTGSFSVSAAIESTSLTDITELLTSFSFSDGRSTLTDQNTTFSSFLVAVDSLGNITEWDIRVADQSPFNDVGDERFSIITINNSDGTVVVQDQGQITWCADAGCVSTQSDFGGILTSPGSWSIIPIPAALWLFGSALGLLGWVKRRAG